MMKSRVITVFGSAVCAPGSPAYETARRLGAAIAEAGWTLCNGGYGGSMEAAAKGAVEAGGHTIGVTCRLPQWPAPANEYIRQEAPTFNLLARLDVLVNIADAWIVLPGGTGTLVELALVWELQNKGLMERTAPIVLLGRHWADVIPVIQREQADALLPIIADDVAGAIAALAAAWRR